MPQIPRLEPNTPIEQMTQALDEAGCLVITNAFESEVRGRVAQAMRPHLDSLPAEWIDADDPEAFYPGKTRRAIAIVERAEAAWPLICHPISTALCQHHLGPQCEQPQLHVTGALEVAPGARAQCLHREEDLFPFFPVPRPNLILASMWAVTEFTADNGGTLLVPGSHRWSTERKTKPEEIVAAEMPAGSVLYWFGGTLHGAGANVSRNRRFGLILTYSVGWLRQEENQSLSITPQTVGRLPNELKALVGREPHGGLGFFDPRVIPAD